MANILIKQVEDHFQNEIRNVVLHKVSGAPGTPVEGQIWYDTATQAFKWRDADSNVNPLDRAAHTGTQTVSTISDRETWLTGHALSDFQVPAVDLSMGTHKITGLVAGTATGHAVEFDQLNTAIAAAVQTAVAGLSYKAAVDAATTGNITLSGNQTIDGVAVSSPMRVLVKDQTLPAANGIYVANAGAWTRATDADSSAELQGGVIVPVDNGTVNADRMYMLASDVTTVGTTAQTWNQFGAGQTLTASLGVQLVGSDIRANLGAGLTLSGNQVVPDFSAGQVMRRKTAVGYVATSGVDITVNHAFGLAVKEDLIVQAYEVGVGLVHVGILPSDANNVVLSFGVTPTTNQYRYVMMGLS